MDGSVLIYLKLNVFSAVTDPNITSEVCSSITNSFKEHFVNLIKCNIDMTHHTKCEHIDTCTFFPTNEFFKVGSGIAILVYFQESTTKINRKYSRSPNEAADSNKTRLNCPEKG